MYTQPSGDGLGTTILLLIAIGFFVSLFLCIVASLPGW